jgi:hypothetical protein
MIELQNSGIRLAAIGAVTPGQIGRHELPGSLLTSSPSGGALLAVEFTPLPEVVPKALATPSLKPRTIPIESRGGQLSFAAGAQSERGCVKLHPRPLAMALGWLKESRATSLGISDPDAGG